MKKFLAYLMIITGTVITIAGLAGTPLILDLLPVELMLPADDHAHHHYFRVVPGKPQSFGYLPYLLVLLGLAALAVGLVLRCKLRGIAA